MVAAVPLLQWLPSQPLLRGIPLLVLFVGHLLWGFAMGLGFQYVHEPLKASLRGKAAGDWIEKLGWR